MSCPERQDQWLLSGIFRVAYLVYFQSVAITDLGAVPHINDRFTKATLCTSFKIQGKTCQSAIIRLRDPDGTTLEGDSLYISDERHSSRGE